MKNKLFIGIMFLTFLITSCTQTIRESVEEQEKHLKLFQKGRLLSKDYKPQKLMKKSCKIFWLHKNHCKT